MNDSSALCVQAAGQNAQWLGVVDADCNVELVAVDWGTREALQRFEISQAPVRSELEWRMVLNRSDALVDPAGQAMHAAPDPVPYELTLQAG